MSKSINAPLQLESYQFSKFIFDKEEEPEPDSKLEISHTIHTHKTDKQRYKIKLHITCRALPTDDGTEQRKLEVELHGFFIREVEIERDELAIQLNISAPSILYGLARGFIAQFTPFTPCSIILLPSVMFGELERIKAEAKQEKKSDPKRVRKKT